MKKLRTLAAVLVAALALSCCPIPAGAAFSDVGASAWYAQDVAAVAQMGILQGRGNGKFDPDGTLTLAEAITMADRAHAYQNGKTISAAPSGAWYQPYLQYAADNGICTLGEFGTSYNGACNRLTMAKLFDRVIPAATAKQRNDVTTLPDVESGEANAAVFHLYQLGVLTGSDKYGTFNPTKAIKRSETAAIINRVVNPEARKTFTLQAVPNLDAVYEAAKKQAQEYYGPELGYIKKMFKSLKGLTFNRYDINGDGVDELLVGLDWTQVDKKTFVLAIYTIVDNHAVNLYAGTIPTGSYLQLCNIRKNGVICKSWASGASYQGASYYKMNGSKLKVVESWAGDYDTKRKSMVYHYSTTADAYSKGSKAYKNVSEATINGISAKYGSPLTVFP